jgi:3-methyladenine DNA glycosylase/8-oxoguanine DNA glycosylase
MGAGGAGSDRVRRVGDGIVVDAVPPWPFRLVRRGGPDGVSRVRDGVFERFLHVDGRPILVRAWERPREDAVRIAAMPAEPEWLEAGRKAVEARRPRRRASGNMLPEGPVPRWRTIKKPQPPPPRRASDKELLIAIDRTRHALGIDDDYAAFHDAFRTDPLLGPAIRSVPWLRARRTFWPWEALAWAITEQLIEAQRAHVIQRRIVARWGAACLPPDRDRPLRDVPGPAAIAARAPAELAALDLAPKRAVAMIKVATEVAAGRIDPDDPSHDERLTAISEIGPWTVQVLGQKGRGEADSLPAGDLAYVKAVPRLAGMERRATVAEVEAFYARFAPYRGWAGLFTLVAGRPADGYVGKPIKYHPANPERDAA